MSLRLAAFLGTALGAGALASADTYTVPGIDTYIPQKSTRSVSIFGPFGVGDKLQERDDAGLPTFCLKRQLPEQRLIWINYLGKDHLTLGSAWFPGQASDTKFDLIDWTTAKQSADLGDGTRVESYFSRSFPAVLYSTNATKFEWRPDSVPFDRVSYRSADGKVLTATPGKAIGRLGSPWLIVWKAPAAGEETIPILVRLARRPTQASFDGVLRLDFGRSADSLAVMPLYGIARPRNWRQGPTADAIEQADFWTRATAAFPVRCDETYSLSKDEQSVTITDRFAYRDMGDDWNTKPLRLAPVPPVTAVAAANGYPTTWAQKLKRSKLATFLGPFAYVEGSKSTYTIGVPTSRDHPLAPTRVPDNAARRQALNDLVAKEPPKAEDYADGGWNLTLKEYSQTYPLLDPATRNATAPLLAEELRRAFDPAVMLTVTEPATGQKYVMNGKIWCAKEAYDREWYAGRQLDAAADYAQWVDPMALKPYWKQISGLYAYFGIYSDWAWSGTSSSVFGYALCGDGMNFAMEGMLGVARLAHLYGDDALYRDASYRAAKQQLCTFASFFLPEWVKDVDYATWTDTAYDYETKKGRYQTLRMKPDEVETRFGLDIYADTTGIRVVRPGMFWHSMSAFFWNNPAEYRLYAERLYDRARKWEYDAMPQLFPGWDDKNVIEKYANSPFGNNHTLTHLDARAVLFGDSEDAVAAHMTKLQPDIPLHFRLRLAGDLLQAGAPQAWAPVREARFVDSVWDTSTKTLTVKLVPYVDGPLGVDVIWRRGPTATPSRPATSSVALPGGFYRVSAVGKKGRPLSIAIRF